MHKKTRIELIDLAKAITIFLVILGHTTGNLDTPLYRRVLYSFHMPLFFFLAGLSIKPVPIKSWGEWQEFLRKNILALVVPYLIWGVIYAPFSFGRFPKLFYASWFALTDIGTLTSLWYLPTLFVARILVQIIISLLYNSKKLLFTCGVMAVPMFVIGFILPKIDGGYPWNFDVAFTASAFILLGISSRQQVLILAQQTGTVLFTFFAISVVLFLSGTVLRADDLDLSLMCASSYGNIFWFMFNSISGSIVFMLLPMILNRIAREGIRPFSVSAITYIGRHTLGIFLIHKNLLQELILPFIRDYISGEFFTAFIGSCIALSISIIVCMIIERYVPQLLGQFPVYKD
ncbi:MAG: acyltransferase family protein [Synergistaceae bacterium]|nr:acyltransferase family protein [Synergistaceae bacterium]